MKIIPIVTLIIASQLNCMKHDNNSIRLPGIKELGLDYAMVQKDEEMFPSLKEDIELASLFVILEKRISDDIPHESDPYYHDIMQKQDSLLSAYNVQHPSDDSQEHKNSKAKRKRALNQTKRSNKKGTAEVKQKPQRKQTAICEYCKQKFASKATLTKHEYRKHADKFNKH